MISTGKRSPMITWSPTMERTTQMSKIFSIASCRVSLHEQLTNNSLSRQNENVIKASKELGAPILEFWSGSVSSKKGTNINRRDIKEMIDFCKKNRQVKFLIVDEPDRFMRSSDEGIYFEVLFKNIGVKVWYASDPTLNGDDLAAKLLKFSKFFTAEGSNDERIRKSINGQTSALKSGKYPFSPKPGYMKGSRAGIPEIHPVRGPVLREVLTRVASQIVTPTEGLAELNNSDYTSERAPIKMDKFRKIATDSFYAGITQINKQVDVRNESALHDPLISLDQHFKLVQIFDNKKKNQLGPRKNGNPEFPMNGITQHETCISSKNKGKFVGFNHSNGKNSGLIYKKYRCRSCGFYISKDELHEKVAELFESFIGLDEQMKDFYITLEKVWRQKEAQATQDSSRLRLRIISLKGDVTTQTLAAIDPSNISIKNEILANIEKLKKQIENLEVELSHLNQEQDTDYELFIKYTVDFISNMGKKFFELSPDIRQKRKQIVFPAGFYVNSEKNVYTPEISPIIRLAISKKDTEVSQKALLVRVQGL